MVPGTTLMAYVLTVPDEHGRNASYTLSVPKGDTVQICTPTAGQQQMTKRLAVSLNGTVVVSVGETPIFVVPSPARLRRAQDDAKRLIISKK